MATTHAETFINRDPDEVWKVFGDFGGLAAWFPNGPEVKVDGKVRIIVMAPGIEITETEVARDDSARTYSYSVAAEMLKANKYVTTCAVVASDGGCIATMDAELDPDELAAMIGPVYEQAIAALAKHFA